MLERPGFKRMGQGTIVVWLHVSYMTRETRVSFDRQTLALSHHLSLAPDGDDVTETETAGPHGDASDARG